MTINDAPLNLSFPNDVDCSIDSPFSVCRFTNPLEPVLYRRLRDTFPEPTRQWIETPGMDAKQYLQANTLEELRDMPLPSVWREFVDLLFQPSFSRSLAAFIQPRLLRYRHRGLLSPALPRRFTDTLDAPDRFEAAVTKWCRPYLQFSHLKENDLNSPHSDSWEKIVTVLMYFPPEGWREAYGGHTSFFKSRQRLDDLEWFTPTMNRVPPKDIARFRETMTPFFSAGYHHNTWVLFCKSVHSFHAVSPIKCPPEMTRRTLVFGLGLEH